MYNVLVFFAMVLFVVALLRHFGETRHFFAILQERHPEKWDELGHPRWSIQLGDPTLRQAMNYIRQKRFTELNDEELERSYKRLKNAERLAFFAAASMLGLMIFDTLQRTAL